MFGYFLSVFKDNWAFGNSESTENFGNLLLCPYNPKNNFNLINKLFLRLRTIISLKILDQPEFNPVKFLFVFYDSGIHINDFITLLNVLETFFRIIKFLNSLDQL